MRIPKELLRRLRMLEGADGEGREGPATAEEIASARAKLEAVLRDAIERHERGEPAPQRPLPVLVPDSPQARLADLLLSRLDDAERRSREAACAS